jgi:peptidoglycan-N-acetylglucosamine deacetylase
VRVTGVVCVSVDLDGVCGLPGGGAGFAERLSSRSERLYGLGRGLERVLDALAAHRVRASFYVPGLVAQQHPDQLHAILAAGHELGHHGHTHRRPDRLSPSDQQAEITDGLAALQTVGGGARVRGYRAPGWELTPSTLHTLAQLGFTHDSSLMADDRPYRISAAGHELTEFPVHWTLDDAPHFKHSTDPSALRDIWLTELHTANTEERLITYTLHPDILGRPHRINTLHQLLHAIADTPTTTHGAAVATPHLLPVSCRRMPPGDRR